MQTLSLVAGLVVGVLLIVGVQQLVSARHDAEDNMDHLRTIRVALKQIQDAAVTDTKHPIARCAAPTHATRTPAWWTDRRRRPRR